MDELKLSSRRIAIQCVKTMDCVPGRIEEGSVNLDDITQGVIAELLLQDIPSVEDELDMAEISTPWPSLS